MVFAGWEETEYRTKLHKLFFPGLDCVQWKTRGFLHLLPWNFLCWTELQGLRKLSWACISLNPHMPFRVAAAWTSSSCLHTRNVWCRQFNRELAWHSESGCSFSFVPVVNPFALHKRWKIGLCYLNWFFRLCVKGSFIIHVFFFLNNF